MDQSHSLTLNEAVYEKLPDHKKPVFLFEWLRYLDKVLVAAQKADIKSCQKKLVEQLTTHMQSSPGPPTRKLIANCLATLFSVGDTFLLFETVNKCNDFLKNKDDSPSVLPMKLCAICCVGSMYEKLGRMMGRSYEETVQILIRSLKSAESQMRIEIMVTMEKVCAGMGTAISNVHKDIYKASKHCLTDRVMSVRIAAAKCLLEMLNHAPFLYTIELEAMVALSVRAFDGSNYEVRCAVANLLGNLIACTQQPSKIPFQTQQSGNKIARVTSLDEAFALLTSGFLRGGGSFLKGTGEMIKGSSAVNREVRVGVTHAYVIFVQVMGGAWLERNLQIFLVHILDLVANPKAASSHVDAVYSRKCINFILHSIIGKMLGENAQTSACKEFIYIITKQMQSIDFSPENAKDSNQETLFSQHLLVCALQELGSLILSLGTTAQVLLTDQTLNLVDAVCAVLGHPCSAARLAAAWCLRCICVSVPSQITPLIDRFVEGIDKLKTSPEAISGYSAALAAVLGSVRLSPLGIPHTKGKVVFNTAEELLRSASQNSRLSLNRIQAGWLLIGSIMTLGVPVVKGLLPRMLLLWRYSFPQSEKELKSEKARGDAFTWQVTLEGRAGALSVMRSFLEHCSELLTDDNMKRFLKPIDSALTMLVDLSSVLKSYGQQLKAPVAMVRLRLYETLSLLSPNILEYFFAQLPNINQIENKKYNKFTHLLQMLVAEFTLNENPANTTNSLLRNLCHADDSIILGTWLQETDHRNIEDQLQPNSAAGSGALEHDTCCLYRPLQKLEQYPGPLPLGVALIDMSIILFGLVFSRSANKHRITMFNHFSECIRQAKSARQEAIQMNVFAAMLSGLNGLNETKSPIGQDDVQKSATIIIIGALVSPNVILKCAASEASGKLAQVVGDSKFTAELAQTSFDKLKSARDVVTRTGHSLALGCLHKNVGGMGSSQHLNTSVSILLALAQDGTSPVVQVWSLYALALIADSGGPMFRSFVEPTLSLAIKLLLTVPNSYVDVHQCVGRVLTAVLTTMGPELQGNTNSITTMRSSFLCACAIMQSHFDPLVQAEATGCLQQLHLFVPRYVNLSSLVPAVCKTLSSNYLMLRKAAVSCLRQLTQREAKEVCEHALILNTEESSSASSTLSFVNGMTHTNSDNGLPGRLFGMLDTETDPEMIKNIHDTITSMLQMLAADNLSQWLALCKNVLTIANDLTAFGAAGGYNEEQIVKDVVRVKRRGKNEIAGNGNGDEHDLNVNDDDDDEDDDDDDDNDDDVAEFHAEENQATHPAVQPRWPTRVFAAKCIRKIITTCETANPLHFDLIQAKELATLNRVKANRADHLILHLSDLIRMAFIAATSHSDQLRLEGLKTLQEIIDKFARVPEPEFPGHLLLEQFQAQVGAALRPAFSPDTPSHVTAAACEVCSAWIGSGVARDLNDLRRVHQLLVSSLSKLHTKTNSTQLYNESMATLEKLSILKAWAEVYVVAMIGNGSAPSSIILKKLSSTSNTFTTTTTAITTDDTIDFGDFESQGESLLSLVKPELNNLSKHWLAALKDHALLLLPTEFATQLPHDGGAFYTNDTMNLSKPHYLASWSPILYAAALWLNDGGFYEEKTESNVTIDEDTVNSNTITTNLSPTEQLNQNENNNATSSTISHGSESADRFHLIFGISMEALCSTRTSEKQQSVILCLQSIYTIFDTKWARIMLFKDSTLAVELCNVLHRLILTRDSLEVQLLCIEIMKRIIAAGRESLEKEFERRLDCVDDNEKKTDLLKELDLLGEGGESGEIIPGQSLVYAVLEVCLCLFVRHIPTMNPSATNTRLANDFQLQKQLKSNANGQLGEDNGMLVSSALQCIEGLPQLCSPKGATQILPTILYLVTGIIKEIATKSINNFQITANSGSIQAALHCLKSIVTNPYTTDDRCSNQWQKLLQSALATIIDLTKTCGNDETKIDEVTMMFAIAVFIRHTPTAKLISAPSLKFPCINHFRQCLQNESNLNVKLKCIQTMRSIFMTTDLKVATPYIHALAPRVIEILYKTRQPKSDIELAVMIECITTVETLIALAEPQNRNLMQGTQMLTLLVPILISFLLVEPNDMVKSSKYVILLNEHALQWLMKIGPTYPQEFRQLMSKSPHLRIQIEAAVRNNQLLANQKFKNEIQNSATANHHLQMNQQHKQKPTIQLKTDFSNFS